MEDDWFGEDFAQKSSVWVRFFESRNNRRALQRLSGAGVTSGRLLEIGVGSGSLLASAQKKGFRVEGIDLSEPVARAASKRHGIKVQCGSIANLKPTHTYDVIVMNHVLEHVASPVEFVTQAVDLLSPNGYILIAVPNIKSLEARLPGWNSYEPYHLLYFDASTLSRVVSEVGLSKVKLSSHESFSGWFLAIVRTLMGINSSDGAAVTKSAHVSVNKGYRRLAVEFSYRILSILFGLFIYPLRLIQGYCGRGDELYCLARKEPSKG